MTDANMNTQNIIQQQTNKTSPEIRQNTQDVQQSTQRRFRDTEETLIDEIDEIIETDPDESQHHPIVDGDANGQQYDIEQSMPENKTQEEDDRYNQNYMAFDGYDSRFFNNKGNLTDEEQENRKLETQKNKARATSAKRRQIMNQQSLMTQNQGQPDTEIPEIEDNSNEQYITTPSQSQKFANFSVTRPLSSAKLRPSDTQKKNGRGNRLLSAHHKNNQKIKVVNSQEQHNKFTQFRETSQQRNMMMQQQNQMMQNKIMRTDNIPNQFYQTQQQFSTNQQNYLAGPPNRNLNMVRVVPPMSAASSNASLQPPYQYIQNGQYQQQSPTLHQERQQYIQYPPQIFDQQIYAGQGYMQQIQPFYYEQQIQKYNNFPQPQPMMSPYHMNQQPIYQMEVAPRPKQATQSQLLLQTQYASATELPSLQPEEAKVISVLDTNVENFQKYPLLQSHIPGLNKASKQQYLGTYNSFIKSMSQESKQASKQEMELEKKQRRESLQLKKQRRQKRIKDKRIAKMEEDNDEQIIYRNSRAKMEANGEFGQASTLNSDMNWYQSPQDNAMGGQAYQDQPFYQDQANSQQAQTQPQQPDEREKLRQKQKQMQLQEKQFRLSMSSMKNQISEVINEDLNESRKSNTDRDPNDNSFSQPKVKMLVSHDNSNVTLSPINIEKGVEDIKEELPVSTTPKQEAKVSSSQKKMISQESQKQDHQAQQAPKEPIEVFNLEHNESVLPEAETQLIKNIFKPSEEEQIKEQENKDDVKDQIKDLMTIKQQSKAPEKNQNPVSYEAFFKNPSGQSETNNMIEDDLLQNQNKSATVIEGEDATYDQVEEEEVKNPFNQENNDNMFNEEYQTSVTLKGQKTPSVRQRSKSPQQQQSEQKKGIQYTQISQQIEGITNLLQNLNNYVSSTTEQSVEKQVSKNEMKETRFSYKMTKFSGLPELPEEPNEQAENDQESPSMLKQKGKNVNELRFNDAQTLKTTQQSSSHKQGGNGEQENIINIQVQNNKKSPARSGKKTSKGQIRIKKIKRQRVRENNNQILKKSLSLTNIPSPDRKKSAEKPVIPFKCGSYRPVQQFNSHSPDMTIPSIQRSLSPKISQAQKRSYLKSAHPSVMQNRHSQGHVTYKRINIKKMKTMHDKKKRSLGGNEVYQYGQMPPQRLQNSMSSMGFSSSNMMSQTLRPSNMNMGQQQFIQTQAHNYLPKHDSRQRANRATTATRQQMFDFGGYSQGNRVFSAHTPGPGDHPQDYIQVHRSSQEAMYRNQLIYQQQKYGSTVRPPIYNQDNTSLTATNKQLNQEQYSRRASQKFNTIQADIELQQDPRRKIFNNSSSPFRSQPISNYIQYGPNMTSSQYMQYQQMQQNPDLRGQELVRYDLPDSQLKSPYNHKIRLAPKGKRPISTKKNPDFYQTQRYGMHEQRPPLGTNQIQQMNDTRTQRMNVNSQQFHGTLHDPRLTQYNKDMPPPHAIGGGILRPQSSAPQLGSGQTFNSKPDSIPASHHYLNQQQQIRPFIQIQSQTNQQNDNRIQSGHDGTQPILNNDYQTRQYMPPLPQESKQLRLASGNSKKQQKIETGLSSVRGAKKKRATSSRGSRLASAQMRNSKGLRNTMRSGSGKGSKGSKGSQIDIINSQRQKVKKQSNGNNNSNNGQQNMQQPVVIQQIFGLGYQPGMVQNNPSSVQP